MKYSKYQEDIFAEMERGTGSMMIEAVAGSGKSFCLVEGHRIISKKTKDILFLAFNVHIRDSLMMRLGSKSNVKTLNGLGFGALKQYGRMKGKACDLLKDKIDGIIDGMLEEKNDILFRCSRGAIRLMADRARRSGIIPGKLTNPWGVPDSDSAWNACIDAGGFDDKVSGMAEKFNIKELEVRTAYIGWLREILRKDIADLDQVDFTDQLYLPLVYDMKFKKYAVIMVDEVQDLSPMDIELIKRCTDGSTRVIGVGDRKQSIYRFRNADANAVNKFITAFECVEFPLPICYRCPSSVISVAQKYNPMIQAWEEAQVGVVREEEDTVDVAGIDSDGMVISRFNAPLIELALDMLEIKKPFQFVGRDFVDKSIELIGYLSAGRTISCGDFLGKLEVWAQKKIAYIVERARFEELFEVMDKKKCLSMLCTHLGLDRPVKEMCTYLLTHFSSDQGVRLSSVHKVKGLEADKVYFLDRDKQEERWEDTEDEQELNILYVGVTRAKKELVFIRTSEIFRDEYYNRLNKLNNRKGHAAVA